MPFSLSTICVLIFIFKKQTVSVIYCCIIKTPPQKPLWVKNNYLFVDNSATWVGLGSDSSSWFHIILTKAAQRGLNSYDSKQGAWKALSSPFLSSVCNLFSSSVSNHPHGFSLSWSIWVFYIIASILSKRVKMDAAKLLKACVHQSHKIISAVFGWSNQTKEPA